MELENGGLATTLARIADRLRGHGLALIGLATQEHLPGQPEYRVLTEMAAGFGREAAILCATIMGTICIVHYTYGSWHVSIGPMIRRHFWIRLVESAWKERTVVWLGGVRRSGKTVLCQSLPRTRYYDCEIPSVRGALADPERFLAGNRGKRIVLDEVHRLDNPSELLKIAADHYGDIRILATGSSTLGATRKFRDTLVGRKANVWLTPMNIPDLADFRRTDMRHRMLHGGLPPFFLGKTVPETAFQDWMDAYWAKDIEELFRLERRASFQKFAELLISRSGGMFEATDFARACEINRATVLNYLSVLDQTFVVHVLKPFSSRRAVEIVSAPRIYAFDTGFVCYYHGLRGIGRSEMGLLWEHVILNELHSGLQTRRIGYWRDKKGHEVDFILPVRGGKPIAIECKLKAKGADISGLLEFGKIYPGAGLILAAADAKETAIIKVGSQSIVVTGPATLVPHIRRTAHNLLKSQYS